MDQEPTTTLEMDDERHRKCIRREYVAERSGMVLIALILLAALLGLLGPGPLTYRTEIAEGNSLTVEHYAIQRYEAPSELYVRVRPVAGAESIRLGISRTWTDRITMEGITPEPVSIETSEDRLVYTFRASGEEVLIVLRYKNDEFGSVEYEVDDDQDASLRLSQFVLP
jgi:hypothetical protein